MDKKCKTGKVYFQTFKEAYKAEFKTINSSKRGDKFAFCDACCSDFSISHGGRFDIVRHVKTEKHQANVNANKRCAKLDIFFKDDIQSEVTKAELLFCSFLVEHNVPIAASDHAGPLFRNMFPKCEVAKQYGCARTKTSAMIGEIALTEKETMIKYMKNGPFAAGCDGSNDSDHKLYPIVVTFFNVSEGFIQSSLFSLCNLTGDSTGENISALIINELEKYEIPIENLIAFMADNAYVMQGKKNGVAFHLKEKHNNLICIGCACHLINLASEKGAAALPVKIDEMLIDIFYYLKKSAKRKEALQRFQNLHNKEAQKILKHSCTRWLSLGRSLLRLLEQWDPLLSFFKDAVKSQNSKISLSLSSYKIPLKKPKNESSSKIQSHDKISSSCKTEAGQMSNKTLLTEKKRKCEDPGPSSKKKLTEVNYVGSKSLTREEKIFMFLSSDEYKAYCLFLVNILPTFDVVNVTLQSAAPHIHRLRQMYIDLLKDLFCKFLMPSAVKNKELSDVKYHIKENQKELSEIYIGQKAEEIVQKLNEEQKKAFYASVLNYYIVSCDYILKKFPINNEILKHAEVANLAKIESTKFKSVKYFIDLFPCIINAINENEIPNAEIIDELEKQFCSLQIEDLSAILGVNKRIDTQWVEVGNITDTNDHFKYKKLSQIMLSILLIPHSNAECERIFSIVKKNRNEFRSSMSNKTLESLLILKTSSTKLCYDQKFSADFVKRAKKATYESLKVHKQ